MTASAPYIEWLKDVLRPLGAIAVRRMFSGAGVYCDGVMFAIINGDQLYLKTDSVGAAAFAAEGQSPFVYATKRGSGQLKSYWQAPDRLSDDSDDLIAWARRALVIARRAAADAATKKARKLSPRA